MRTLSRSYDGIVGIVMTLAILATVYFFIIAPIWQMAQQAINPVMYPCGTDHVMTCDRR